MPLSEIQSRIIVATECAGRFAGDVCLIAVSKVQPNMRVAEVLAEGHRIFGENKVQEAQGKWPEFRLQYPDAKVHLIGPLQSNKVKPALDLFDAIHTVDRPKLARKLAAEIQLRGQAPEMFIQVNTGEEPQKAGVLPADLDAFMARCRNEFDLPIVGLMVIPPINDDPGLHFALLAKMAKRNGLTGLSMGMSSDFESAIAHGATHIRVGSAIFGERVKL
ncbi:MAG: YggS family pyridoxal phosphate-dependent enzyme [Rhodobacteraceae bacterium]|nr:YggS family pyridoxal phosphate-dependent enzyme [Paracoccaceae bacterium]